MSLSLTYGSPEASCIKQVDTYFGRRDASLIKEFWTLCILSNQVPEAQGWIGSYYFVVLCLSLHSF